MINAVCIERYKDKNGIIVGYKLKAINGDTIEFKPEQVKHFIKTNQLEVMNLTLTSG